MGGRWKEITELLPHASYVFGGFGGIGIQRKIVAEITSKIDENESCWRPWAFLFFFWGGGEQMFQASWFVLNFEIAQNRLQICKK